MDGFAIFETAIGDCGVAWTNGLVVGVQLPTGDDQSMRARMTRRHPLLGEAEPPQAIARLIESIQALLVGKRIDFDDAELDISALTPFERRVLEAAREIPPGRTVTYGEIARRIGAPHAAREVGAALGRNPFPIIIPCHRVIAANGKTGGFSAPGGVKTKLRLLAIEGGDGPLFEQSFE